MTQVRSARPRSLVRDRCRHCGHTMLFHPDCGWVVLHPGEDECPDNDLGRHEPNILAPRNPAR